MARILLVEDEVLLRYILAEWLRTEGHEVMEATSGDEAHAMLSSIIDIDLVLTDVRMPGALNGLELTRQIRAVLPGLPVIVLSADMAHSEARDAGASAFFSKPCNFDLL